MLRKVGIVFLSMALAITAAGCYAQVNAPTQSTSLPPDTQQQTSPQPDASGPSYAINHVEPMGTKATYNIRTANAGYGLDVFPTADGSSVYFPGTVVRYYDMASDTSFAACPIPGCTHENKTCPSRIPGALAFCADENYWCAFTQQDWILSFLRIDVRTGERTVLHTWERGWRFGEAIMSSGCVLADLSYMGEDQSTARSYVSIDLARGTVKEFARADEMGEGRLAGGSANVAIMEWLSFPEPLLTTQQWLKENPGQSEEDYFAYTDRMYNEEGITTIRKFDLATGTYEDMQLGENVRLFSDPNICYNDHFVYRKGNSVMLGSITGKETRTVFTADGISTAWLMDGRVFILRRLDGNVQEWVADMDGGEALLLHDYGQVEGITFSAVDECKDYFFGLDDHGSSYISKADYYAGKFDKAIAF